MNDENINEVLETKEVSNKSLTKEQLLEKLEVLNTAHNNAVETLQKERENFNKVVADIQTHYSAVIKDLESLTKYYERKFAIIKDLINIEGEK